MITYKFRLYPTRTQARLMGDTMETCRRLYNDLLDNRMRTGAKAFEQKRALTAFRQDNKFLSAVHSQVLQDVVFRLDKAYSSFFTGRGRYPKFKRKGRYNSFMYPQIGGFKVAGEKLRLSKIGLVRAKFHRHLEGRPKTCTIVRDIDQWYACISAETEPVKVESQADKPVGVDLGVIIRERRRVRRTGRRPRSCSPRLGGRSGTRGWTPRTRFLLLWRPNIR